MNRQLTSNEKTAINRLYQDNPTTITSLFTRKPKTTDRVALLNNLASYAALPDIAPLIVAQDVELQQAVLRKATALLAKLPPHEWSWLDEALRRRFYGYSSPKLQPWYNFAPSQLNEFNWSGQEQLTALTLLSCHFNGRVREKALKQLVALSPNDAIPLLFVRANDWVNKIRLVAYTSLSEQLDVLSIDQILKYLLLLDQLKHQSRTDHHELIKHIESHLATPEAQPKLLFCVSSGNHREARVAYGICDRLLSDKQPLLVAANESRNPIIRIKGLSLAPEVLSGDELFKHLCHKLSDPLNVVRKRSIYLLAEQYLAQSTGVLRDCLLDTSRGVRECARFYLKKQGADNGHSLYKNHLAQDSPKLLPAVLGLGETGSVSDWPLLQPYLNHASPKIRHATLIAASRFKVEGYQDLLYQKLTHGIPAEVKAAKQGLIGTDSLDLNRLKQSLEEAPDNYQAKTVRKLIERCDRWEGLIAILVSDNRPPDTEDNCLEKELTLWLHKHNKGYWFIPPKEHQVNNLKCLMNTRRPSVFSDTSLTEIKGILTLFYDS
ncbi:HEAT repeat domain-containing protein [Porticoccus sp. GXU_MW_L64]